MQDKLHWTVKAWHFKKNHSVIVSGYYFLSLESLPKDSNTKYSFKGSLISLGSKLPMVEEN